MIMIRLFATHKIKTQVSFKKSLWALLLCASAAAWIGISTVQADENDPGDNMENTELTFQNAAQEQHAKNLAIKATLQDEAVMSAISQAKEAGNYEEARTLFKQSVTEYMQEISDKRADGEGWGNIAKDLGVHPRYLGLGHYKNNAKFAGYNYSSQNKDLDLAPGHSEDKSGGHGFGQGGGNGHGNGGGNGVGQGGGKK
jgi:hypothetical protein